MDTPNLNEGKSVKEKEINGELYILDGSLEQFKNNESSIVFYSPLTLYCFYSRKGQWIYHNDISIKYSHPVTSFFFGKKVPKYIDDALEEAFSFRNEEESGYSSVDIMGYIYLNTFIKKWIIKDESKREQLNATFYIDEFDDKLYYSNSYKDRHGCTRYDYKRASVIAGMQWINIVIEEMKKREIVKNILSLYCIPNDIIEYVLYPYLEYSYLINDNMFTSFLNQETVNNEEQINIAPYNEDENIRKVVQAKLGSKEKTLVPYSIINLNNRVKEDELTKYRWVCKLYYYCYSSQSEKFEFKDLSVENGMALGFPLHYNTNKKYYRADILFVIKIDSKDKEEEKILFRANDVVKIINLKISEYKSFLNYM